MEYTNLSTKVVFLKDADIAYSLDGKTISSNIISSNGIPAFELVKDLYLSTVISVDSMSTAMNTSVDNLLTGDITYTGKNTYTNAISVTNASVDVIFADAASTNQLTTNTATLSNISVNDVALISKLSATNFEILDTDDVGFETGRTAISANDYGIKVDLVGNRTIDISVPNGINNISVNSKSLSGYIHDEAELCAEGSKQYVDDKILSLTYNKTIVDGQIISSITETNGIISVATRSLLKSDVANLTSDLNNLSTNYVKKSGDEIEHLSVKTALSSQNLYVTNTNGDPIRKANLSVDINGISAELSGDTTKINITYDDKLSGMTGIVINNKTLSKHVTDKIAEDFTSFNYSQDAHTLSIELAGKILSVDTTEFIKLRFVHYVNILTIDTIKYLVIWIKQFDDYSYIHGRIEGEDYVKILLDALAKFYVFQNGLSSDGNLNVEVDTTIPRFADLVVADKFDDAHRRGYVISSLVVDDNGKLQYGTYKLLSSDVDKLSDYVTNEISLSANELTGLLSSVSSDLSNRISSKIWIKDPTDQRSPFYDGIYSDLSVVKIGIDEYKEYVKTDPNSILSSNTLYVISSDYVETFGQQIKNVGAPTADDDATTKKYVDTELNATSSYLSGQIASNDTDITYLSGVIVNPISADLYDLKDEHYNKTFIDNDRTSHDDIETDNLIITDMDDNGKTTHHDKWYTTFLSGTIVLKKLS